jgi:hypothetical protein
MTRAGGLQVGESLNDPWFLRLKPLDGVRYTVPVEGSTAVVRKDVINNLFLRCSELSVGEWEIRAVATITAPAGLGVSFKWSLDGKSLGSGSIDGDQRASTLTSKVPVSSKETLTLVVQAKDKSGFTSRKQTDIELPASYLACKATVALLTPERKSPATPIDGEIFRPAIAIFHESADQIVRNGRTLKDAPIH